MKKQKSIYRKYHDKNSIIVFCIVLFIVFGMIFLGMGLSYKENIKCIYRYEAKKSDNYEAILKPNEFYTTSSLPKDLYYASKSVDKFILEFRYNFLGSEEADIEYNYKIIANMVATAVNNNDQGKEVWNRQFEILDNVSSNTNKNEFSVNKKVDIDYGYYNNLARSYEEVYGISINAILKVYFNISYNIKLQGSEENNKIVNDYIELDIPITSTVTNIEEKYQDITEEEIMPPITEEISVNKIYYTISIIFIIGAIILVIIMKKSNKKTPEDIYKKNIKHVLKYYKELIVTITNEPDFSNLKLMQLSSIDDLINVAEQNNSNIIHYELIKNKKSELYVIINGYVYIYIIT